MLKLVAPAALARRQLLETIDLLLVCLFFSPTSPASVFIVFFGCSVALRDADLKHFFLLSVLTVTLLQAQRELALMCGLSC
jgi:hypothetical protein